MRLLNDIYGELGFGSYEVALATRPAERAGDNERESGGAPLWDHETDLRRANRANRDRPNSTSSTISTAQR